MPGAAPHVSVILPAYNAAKTLPACLDSLLAQTFDDFEIVLIDDGSTDGTLDVAKEYAARDSRIRPVESEHAAIVEALRRACGLVRGQYLARMDADDVCRADRFEKQLALLESDSRIVLCGTGVRITGASAGSGYTRYEGWINGLTTHEAMFRELFVECPIPHPTFLMRRDAFERAGGYQDRGWPEDYDLVMRFAEAGGRFAKVPGPLLEWRAAPDRLSLSDPRYAPGRFRALKGHYLPRIHPRPCLPLYQWGAGEVGKRWLRDAANDAPLAVVDINPRKIGRKIHGVPVIAPDELPAPGELFVIVAVGSPGARDEIRAWFREHGYEEIRDFLFVA